MIENGRWVFVCPKEGTVKEQRENNNNRLDKQIKQKTIN